jgi:hypothetical protein
MTGIEPFIAKNFAWILTAAFGAGGFVFLLKSLSKRLDRHEQAIDARFSEFLADHQTQTMQTNDHAVRIARLEERTDALSDMKAQVADIWKHFMRNATK